MQDELPIVSKVYDIILWSVPRLAKLPRNHRFLLGDRIAVGFQELMALLVRARYAREKKHMLKEASARLDILRLEIRLMKDLRLFSLSRYEYLAREMNEVGRMLGGWLKSAGGRA
ncbi:diversity-generating retroelement protein Avd [Acidobacteriota bacterium]